MIGVQRTGLVAPSSTYAIVRPGQNCWRVERADRFYCVQDAADYFRLVRQALLSARQTVFILGWDIFGSVDLVPDATATDRTPSTRLVGGPTRLDELLAFVARRRPHLRCYILIWDYAALYTLERDPLSRWRLGWRMPRHVRFGFDDRHPVGGSHHQKVIVVDDQLAFCGGIDLTTHRWDTSAHRIEEPARVSTGGLYGPYHEVQAMVTGPVATSLGALARDRWRRLGTERMPAVRPSSDDLWPEGVVPDLSNVNVAIARTMPGSGTQPSVRECESLLLDSIAAARQSIYIESQYFTNEALAHALASRLREPGGPEVVVVTPRECHGWIEQNTMCAFRNGVCRALRDADRHRRLRLVYPAASRARDVATFVHSKVMVIDDVLVRIGSANYSRRSMGVDTECDLAVDAGNDRHAQAGVRHIRDRLLAEHLGISVDELGRELQRAGSLRGLIDARDSLDRTLVRVDLPAECPPASEALRAAADPDKPIWFESSLGQLVPPVDATNGLRPFPIPLIPTIVFASAVASTSSALIRRREFQAFQDALVAAANLPSAVWVGAGMVLVASLALIPLELAAVAAGVFFGAVRGGLAALLGSIVAAAIGYLAGRLIGPAGLARWISLRSYRSARQLGARGAIGVAVLRLASVASAASVHLICGAGRVPFWAYMAGTVIAITPAIAALSGLGALVRHTMLHPSAWNAFLALGTCLLLFAITAGLRTLLLLRQFAPSMSKHRARAEFG